MRFRDLALIVGGIGTGMLVYGALVESKRLIFEERDLLLPDWPKELDGFRIVVVSDLHIRDKYSVELARRAIEMAMSIPSEMMIFPGDFVDYWKPGVIEMVRAVLAPLESREGEVLAVPGNHDYRNGHIEPLQKALREVGVPLLRNEKIRLKGVTWLGIDSAVEKHARPCHVAPGPDERPAIAIWHEGDLVGMLPEGCALQISGHSHGGQWRFPGGFTPMHSYLGKKYPSGWYPDAPTPLYVTRGVGTTGPPTRFNCAPEISVLTLRSPAGTP